MTPTPSDSTLRDALALLLAGQVEAGLKLYGRRLHGDRAEALPVGSHLLFLERAGRGEAAARLRALAVRRGVDVALHALSSGAAADDAARDYRALFERGIGNARMVSQYLLALAQLGRPDEVAAILDEGRLLRRVRLPSPQPAAVQRLLIAHEASAAQQRAVQSVREMRKLDHFERLGDPVALALTAALKEEARRYLADWAASDHGLAALVPSRARLKAWGLISRGEGFNAHHIHHKGWATGIYYPAAAEGRGDGGALRIGPPPSLGERAPGWPDAAIRPEPGLLVLIPSFYTHWTVPLGRPGLRTSIAFDLIGADRAPRRIDAAARLG